MCIPDFKSFLFFIVCIVGCSSPSSSDPLLEEAFKYHQLSMETAKEIKAMMKTFPVNDPKVKSIKERFKVWNENIIEVPGFDHDHDHDHDHGPSLKLSPEDMLLVQKEMLDSIHTYKVELAKLHKELLQ